MNFDYKFIRKNDVLQIRYSRNGELAKVLQTIYFKSYKDIKLQREMGSAGERAMIKLPEDCKEYLAIYTTEYDDSYILETIEADDIAYLKQTVTNQSELY